MSLVAKASRISGACFLTPILLEGRDLKSQDSRIAFTTRNDSILADGVRLGSLCRIPRAARREIRQTDLHTASDEGNQQEAERALKEVETALDQLKAQDPDAAFKNMQ